MPSSSSLHNTSKPIEGAQLTCSHFSLTRVLLHDRFGSRQETVHGLPTTTATHVNVEEFLRHLGFSETAACLYRTGERSLCVGLPADADWVAFGHVLDGALANVNQAFGEAMTCGIKFEFSPNSDPPRFLARPLDDSRLLIDGHSGGDIHTGESRSDEKDGVPFGFSFTINEIRQDDGFDWTLHSAASYGEVPDSSERALRFLGFREFSNCQYTGGRCFWRSLSFSSDLSARPQAQQWLYNSPGHLRNAVLQLMNADSILERYGLELLPRPKQLSPSEAALGDPDRTFCFVDTNLLVHAKFLNEVRWAELCGTKKATVVISVTVLDELQKIDYNQRARKRARNRSAQVTNLLIDFGADAFRLPGAHLRDGVGLTILKDTPRPSTDEGFDPNHQDDRLHVEVLQMMDRASRVLLITHDRPMFLRAQSRGIPVLLAPNEVMLPPEPDPKDQEIESLRAEVKELREKVGDLSSGNSQPA